METPQPLATIPSQPGATKPAVLARPFDRIFGTMEVAEAAFAMLRRGLTCLGLGPNDGENKLVSCTVRDRPVWPLIRVNYYRWAVLAVHIDEEKTLGLGYSCRDDLIPAIVTEKPESYFDIVLEGHKYGGVQVTAAQFESEEVKRSFDQCKRPANPVWLSCPVACQSVATKGDGGDGQDAVGCRA